MLDMHCHLLPGIDDGSDSVETTIKMLQMLRDQGVTQVAATPHFYAGDCRPEDFLQRREQSLSALAGLEGLPEILPGAEVAYFDSMGQCTVLQELAIGRTGLVLVEMPFADWSARMISELERLKFRQGLQPVLAHVERYRGKTQLAKFLPQLEEIGVAMQCNAEAFLDRASCRWATAMVKKGYVQFLGTDAHNLTGRAPRYGQAVAVLQKKLPAERVAQLTTEF